MRCGRRPLHDVVRGGSATCVVEPIGQGRAAASVSCPKRCGLCAINQLDLLAIHPIQGTSPLKSAVVEREAWPRGQHAEPSTAYSVVETAEETWHNLPPRTRLMETAEKTWHMQGDTVQRMEGSCSMGRG
jgi:hypothetical protein